MGRYCANVICVIMPWVDAMPMHGLMPCDCDVCYDAMGLHG